MAGPGSTSASNLIAHQLPTKHLADRAYRKLLFQLKSLSAARYCDAVLNFGRVDYLWSIRRARPQTPLVARFGNPLRQDEIDWLLAYSQGHVRLISVSNDQRRDVFGGDWTTVYNAVDCSKFDFSNKPSGYLAFLGRLWKTKGVEIAIDVAKRSCRTLKIAGNIPDGGTGRDYFDKQIAPHLGPGVEWIGEIGDAEKSTFLGGADALLMPTMFREPCANVIPEALACGTPVIALANGSVPEVVDHGRTGFVCADADALVAAVGRISEIDRARCRATCEARFDQEAMIDRYENVLLSAVHGKNGQRTRPAA